MPRLGRPRDTRNWMMHPIYVRAIYKLFGNDLKRIRCILGIPERQVIFTHVPDREQAWWDENRGPQEKYMLDLSYTRFAAAIRGQPERQELIEYIEWRFDAWMRQMVHFGKEYEAYMKSSPDEQLRRLNPIELLIGLFRVPMGQHGGYDPRAMFNEERTDRTDKDQLLFAPWPSVPKVVSPWPRYMTDAQRFAYDFRSEAEPGWDDPATGEKDYTWDMQDKGKIVPDAL